jgi:Cu/Ag efflux protein CusF
MRIQTRLALAVASTLLWTGTAPSQTTHPPAQPASRPATVEGHVVKIDRTQGRVTIRAGDGIRHEFQASPETLQDLKEGDRIQARLRQP